MCINRALSRREIESVFEHFTKLNNRKMDSSQNSVPEKRTLHKIQYQKTGLFTKFIIRKTDSSQNSMYRYESFSFSGNSILFLKKAFQAVFQIDEILEVGSCNFERFFYSVRTNFVLLMESDSVLRIRRRQNVGT